MTINLPATGAEKLDLGDEGADIDGGSEGAKVGGKIRVRIPEQLLVRIGNSR